ncbi:hypothetical protein LSH36_20g15077 [Paralvinella palmiformis]|uniref:Uncharacterized protein n=1 Tax=Paralvinella palmiformis TaxID=53620 RepID=A0AAD9NFI7_9ANNE|nr:hypothetical protein LSH36_20g15077 [Paralvinella palmiformis]
MANSTRTSPINRDTPPINGEISEEPNRTLKPGPKRKRNDTEQVSVDNRMSGGTRKLSGFRDNEQYKAKVKLRHKTASPKPPKSEINELFIGNQPKGHRVLRCTAGLMFVVWMAVQTRRSHRSTRHLVLRDALRMLVEIRLSALVTSV